MLEFTGWTYGTRKSCTVDEFRNRLGVPAMNRCVFALAAMGAIPVPPACLAPHELLATQANIVEPANQLCRQATACRGPFGGRLVNRNPLTGFGSGTIFVRCANRFARRTIVLPRRAVAGAST